MYYVVGGQPEYSNLLRTSIASLRAHHDPTEVDIAVLCDEAYAPCIDDLRSSGIVVAHTAPNNSCPVSSSMRKIDVFNALPSVVKYDVVLFLDCDIVVLGPLNPIFNGIKRPDMLYTCREHGPDHHTHIFWSLGSYTREQLQTFVDKDIGVFNCGQYAFVPSHEMKRHFDVVRSLIASHKGRFFYEQSFMNYHFNGTQAIDDTVLTPHVHLHALTTPAPPTTLIVHFANASVPWQVKLAHMHDVVAS